VSRRTARMWLSAYSKGVSVADRDGRRCTALPRYPLGQTSDRCCAPRDDRAYCLLGAQKILWEPGQLPEASNVDIADYGLGSGEMLGYVTALEHVAKVRFQQIKASPQSRKLLRPTEREYGHPSCNRGTESKDRGCATHTIGKISAIYILH
jgi:hypothetical protein